MITIDETAADDKHAPFWDKQYEKKGSKPQSPFTAAMHHRIRELIPDDVETILDAGCGAGTLMEFLAREGSYSIEGVDISPEGVRVITEQTGMRAQVGDVCNLHQFSDNSFDLVVCSEVTEHLPEPMFEKAMSELFRVSRKYVITTNPFHEKLRYHQLVCKHCQTRYHPAGHIHSLDAAKLTSIANPHASRISHFYSGQREYRSLLYSEIVRMCGRQLIDLECSCPMCETRAVASKWSIPLRLTGYVYRSVQLILRRLGVHSAANIIMLAEVK